MMIWFKILPKEILQDNDFIRTIEVDGRKLCIIKAGSGVFATQPYCPHAGASLAYGWCREKKLICPYHRYEYDLYTGMGAKGQGDYINVYPVEVRDDGIYVGLKRPFNILKKLFRL